MAEQDDDVRDRPDLTGETVEQRVLVDGAIATVTLRARCSTCGGPIFTVDPPSLVRVVDGRNAAYGLVCRRCMG